MSNILSCYELILKLQRAVHTLLQLPCWKEEPCDRKGLWNISSKWFRDIKSSVWQYLLFRHLTVIGNSQCVRIWDKGRVWCYRTGSKPSSMRQNCEWPRASKWVFKNPIPHQKHQMLIQGCRDAFTHIPGYSGIGWSTLSPPTGNFSNTWRRHS